MVDGNDALSDSDLRRIADLHNRSIDDSVPSLLGGRSSERVFAYLDRSPRERIFIERMEGRIESCCVVSLEPESLDRRILVATSPGLLWDALRALILRPAFRYYLWHRAKDVLRGAMRRSAGPEITYIFTNPSVRSRGLGHRLVERVDAFLADREIGTYFVRTIDAPSNRALGFYDRHGFERIGRHSEGGRTFVEFERRLG